MKDTEKENGTDRETALRSAEDLELANKSASDSDSRAVLEHLYNPW